MKMEEMIIASLDDHLIEPPGMYDRHLTAGQKHLAPAFKTDENGIDYWDFDGHRTGNIGLNAVVGRPKTEFGMEPVSLSQMREGCYDLRKRVDDMNVNGVLASLPFPTVVGMDGIVFHQYKDRKQGLTLLQAYNDWHVDEWCGAAPGRFIPNPLVPSWDMNATVEEVKRLSRKGVHSVCFHDNPSNRNLPSFHNEYWDPFWKVCSDHEVVVSMHHGTGNAAPNPGSESPIDAWITCMSMSISLALADLLHLNALRKYPNLKLALIESGVGWIPYVLERAEFIRKQHSTWTHSTMGGRSAFEVFRDHFLCTFVHRDGGLTPDAIEMLGARASVERHLLRNGDVWIGLEASNGTKFGPQETLSGGVAHLHKFDKARYGELSLPGGMPEDWPDLTPGNLGRTSKDLNFGVQNSYAMSVFLQEIHRGYAQGPDLLSQLARLLKEDHPTSPLHGAKVRRTFSYGASGGTTLLTPYIQYHHDRAMLPDGRPPFDGYLVTVGQQPPNRPKEAVMVFLDSEMEAKRKRAPLPENTDCPRFRLYEIPGAGHMISAPVEAASATERSADHSGVEEVLPEGIAGLTARGSQTEFEPYDKINAPITWGIWTNMYAWLDQGRPMPIAPPIERDPKASDNIARDEHGNAKGGLRTPWVDVPEGRYVSSISPQNPLRAGIKRFDDAKMKALYGSHENYQNRCRAEVDRLVREGWISAIDADLMKSSCR